MLSGNPLLNDDRNLNTQAGLELGAPPVGLANPLFSGGSPMAGLQNPVGLQSIEEFQRGIDSVLAPRQPAPVMPSQGQIFYSPSTGDIVVNGAEPFNEQNASAALASEQWANQPARRFTLPDTASDWREMPREEYAAYLDGIRNPSFGRRMSEANEHAWRGMGDVALGASLAVNPEWEWAQTARENLRQEFINDAPFLMRLQEIENPGDAMTYAAQMAVQGVPWLVETLASMGVGALIGGAVSGGAGAPAGAVEGFVANQAIRAATRRSIETALRQNLARGARAYQQAAASRIAAQQGAALTREEVAEFAVRNSIASADDVNRFFNFGERAYHMSRGGNSGAVAAMFGSNYMTGVGDIRNSIEDAGGDPQSAEAIANIWGLSLPYALIESLGDIIITQPLTNIGPNILNATARSARVGDQLLARGSNIARGAGIVGASEGVEEGAQYLVTQQGVAGATNQPINIEPMDLLENAAGGFFAGAGLGGITYGFKRPDVRLEDGGLSVDGVQPNTPSGPLAPEGGAATMPFYGTQDTTVRGQDVPPPPAYMGGLEPPNINPNYGNAGPLQVEPTGRPVPDTYIAEREALLNTLQDPTLTDEQYSAIVQALDALEGGRDTNIEAGDRYRAGANRGVLPEYGSMPEYQEPEILDTTYNRETDPGAIATGENMQDVPPGMSTLDRPARSRHPTELWQAINNGEQLEPREMQTLREAVQTLARQNPTNPGYTDVLNQLDRIEAEWSMDEYTDPDSDAFRARFPELTRYLETKPEGFKQSPMDAARPPSKAQPTKARALPKSNVPVTDDVNNPMMPDGQRKYGPHRLKKPITEAEAKARQDGLRGRTEEQTAEPDLIEQARKAGKKEKNRIKQREKRQKKAALKKSERQAERDAKMREMAERTEEAKQADADKRAMRPFGRKDQERQDRYEAERRANEEAARESVLPDAVEEQVEEAAPRAEPKPEPKKRTTESDDLKEAASIKAEPKTEKEQSSRQDTVYKQGMRHYKDLFKFLQGARGKLGRSKKFSYEGKRDEPLPYTSTTKWLVVNDEAISFNELTALIERIRKEFTATESTERSARVFHDYVNDAWQQNKSDPKFFASFVEDNVDEITNWLSSETSNLLPPARAAAQKILGSLGDTKQAGIIPKGTVLNPEGRPKGGVVSDILRKVLADNPDFTFRPVHPTNRKKAQRVIEDIHDAQRTAKVPESTVEQLQRHLGNLRKEVQPKKAVEDDMPPLFNVMTLDMSVGQIKALFGLDAKQQMRMRELEDKLVARLSYTDENGIEVQDDISYDEFEELNKLRDIADMRRFTVKHWEYWAYPHGKNRPIQSGWVAEIDLPGFKPLKKSIAQDTVKSVQQRIFKDFRFRTTHVFADMKDFWDKVGTTKMIAPNGAEYTMAQYLRRMSAVLKLERPEFAHLDEAEAAYVYVEQYMKARAVVIGGFDTLIVFSGHMQTKRELLEVLEHEYIVHKGLSAIFKDNEQRHAFLARLMSIPGMVDKRDALINRMPAYRVATPLGQLEEVLAFHAMEGPLALEALLSAPQAFDQETKTSLWEDFKRIVMEWIERVFGNFRTDENEALTAVTMALRDYAMTGRSPDLHSLIESKATLSRAEVDALMADIDADLLNDTRRAVMDATPTPEETYELLHGQGDNVGRPYTPRSWQDDVISEVRSDDSLMAKLDKIANGKVATPIKEGLKKIARELVTMNQMAMESPLVERMMEIMDNTIKRARFLMSTWTDARPYAHRDFLTTELTKRWGDKAPGATDKQRATYGRMAIAATNHLLSKLSDAMVRSSPRMLVRHPDGTYTINYEVFKKLLERGTLSKEAFANGLQQYTVDGEGEVTEASVAKFTPEEIESAYEIYLSETKLMAESALVTLEDATIMLSRKNDKAIKRLIRDNKFKESDQAFVNEALQRMYRLYTDIAFQDYGSNTVNQKAAQADKARQVLAELMRTFWEPKKVKDWTDSRVTRDDTAKSPRKNDAFKWREQVEPHEDVKPFVNQIRWFLEYDETVGDSRLARLGSLGVTDNRQYHMLSVFQSLLNSEVLAHEKENKVIQSILGNYVEMTRKGKWRVSLEVYEEDGKTKADISPLLLAKLPSIYAESKREADAIQAELAKEFGDKAYQVNNAAGDAVNVKFDVAVAMAPGQATMTDAPDIEGFLKVSELVGLKLGATQMKKITQLIANASIRKRYGLQRAGSPGMDADIIRNNSETMTQRAWEAAKTSQSYMLEEELADEKLRYGDWDHLAELQRKFDVANRGAPEGAAPPVTFVRNPDAVIVAEQSLLRYANQLRHVARRTTKVSTVDIRTTKGELKLKITGEAEAYITQAKALRESLDKNQLELNLNDLISKTGALRQIAVVSQLGTIAAGVMNAFTPITHLPARLMALHEKTGYGEGFGLSEVVTEIASAMSQVMTVFKGYGDTVMLKDIVEEARKNNTTGLTLAELEAMYAETLNGVLTPTQTVSLTGGTESNIRSVLYRNVSNVFLKPFSSVEAGTRRVAFLSSYRLLKRRYIAAGVGTKEELETTGTEAYKKLVRDVERIIKDSQGDYNNVNRPRAFRGDLAQYVLQYKMFPLMTVLLINNLPMAQKSVILGTLFLLAGLKGEPFADDFMDIYDTVMQKLGFQHDSLELSMVQFFEDVLPGSSKWIMRGAIDNFADGFGWSGGTMSSRLAMGDILPLTGLFRPEADVGREIVNAFGPAFAANMDVVEYASILTDHALEFSGLRPRTSAWEDLFRKFPQGQVRGIGEAISMAATGEISDPRGRLTSDEVTIYNIFMRALGFYPLEASKANDTVRLDRMHTGYMRNVRTRFVLAYARAYRADDEAGMERIMDAVRDWNEAAEMTGQEDMMIRNFRSAGVRAGRAASQTTVERTAASAPDYSLIEELAAATGADTETDE